MSVSGTEGSNDKWTYSKGIIESMWKTFAEIGEIAANSQTSFVAEYSRTKDTCKLDELVHDGTSTSVHNDQSTRSSLPNADGSSSQGAQIQPGPSRSN